MKKTLSIVAMLLLSVSIFAVEGVNVMAYGLKGTYSRSDDGATLAIEYTLNTDAEALDLELYNAAEQEILAIVPLSDAELLTEGHHATTVTLPEDELEECTIAWALHAYGGVTTFTNVLTVGDPRYSFYLPQDVVVDNSFESAYFGRIYVSSSTDGQSDGGSATTKEATRGLYYYDALLDKVNDSDAALEGYDGGLTGNRLVRNGFKRLAIDEQGYVYVASRDEETMGVYRANPADLTAPFDTVLKANAPVDALDVAAGKLYTIEGIATDDGGFVNTYSMTEIPVGEPTKQWSAGELTFANADASIRCDGRGGWWLTQHRYALDANAPLMHLNKKGRVDFTITTAENADLLSNAEGGLTYRGTLGVSVDGNMLALGSNKRAVVFVINWDDEGVPTLTKLCETPAIGGNIDGVAFDAADNLYVACATAEQFRAYPIAKEEGSNHCRVYAASAYSFAYTEATEPIVEPVEQLYITGNIAGAAWNAESPIEMQKVETGVFEAVVSFEAADDNGLAYFALATEKGSWDAFNGSRFGAVENNATVAVGAPVGLVAGGDGACVTIAAGTYTVHADMNALQLSVEIAEGVESAEAPKVAAKRIENGMVVIERNGVRYTTQGVELK